MGFFDSFADLFASPNPACEKCRDAGRGDVTMESDVVYDPSQGLNVDAWVCDCGHSVYRGDPDGDVRTHEPTAGTAPERERSGGSTGVLPMDGGYDDDDNGWQSVR